MSQELFKELYEAKNNAKDALTEAKTWGIERANAEKAYRTALGKKMAKERAKGIPVTIIQDICKSDEEIAELRLKRDLADVMYKNAMESINVYKKDIQTISDEIKREWGRND